MTLDIALLPVAAVGSISLALALLVWMLLTRRRTSPRVLANLGRGRYGVELQPKQPGGLDPRLLALAYRLSPDRRVRALNGLWTRAGRPDSWSMDRLVVAKLLLPAVAAVLGLLFFAARPGVLALLLTVVAMGVCYFLPELLLHSRGQERSQQIALELADTLDQMTIAVEAGLGFDAAMIKAGRNGQGPLAAELVRTLQDIQVGHSRREAYEALAARTGVVDLRRFVRSIIQADRYGVAVADVLRTQAAEMRLKRRQRAEEKAMQVPVKVIFPLMLCILPTLFIVLLGPAVMNIVATFSR